MHVWTILNVYMAHALAMFVFIIGFNSSSSNYVESNQKLHDIRIDNTVIRKRQVSNTDDDYDIITDSNDRAIVTLEEYILNFTEPSLQNHTRALFQLCPNTKLCEYLIEGRWIHSDACCLQCSCEETCGLTGSCCPHRQTRIAHHMLDKILTCKMYSLLDRYQAVSPNEYLFVDTCPTNADIRLKEACERVVHNKTFVLDDVTPITDRTMPRNYQNRHCAACHNISVDNLEMWSPDIRCKKPLFGAHTWSTIENAVLHQQDCFILFQPPDVKGINFTRCSSDVISECNITGKWIKEDAHIEAACNELQFRYTVRDNKTGFKIYRNIFCALCNGETLMINGITKPCNQNGNADNFFRLLVSVQIPVPDDENELVCAKDGLFDPITMQCRIPVCSKPMLLDLNDFTCRDIINTISKGVYILSFKIVPRGGGNRQLHSPDRLRHAVHDAFYWSDAIVLCPIKLLFKINQTFHELTVSKPFIPFTELLITEILLVAPITLHIMENPNKELNRIISAVTNYKLLLDRSLWSIIYPAQTDELLHTGTVIGGPTYWLTISSLLWDGLNTSLSVRVFEDPYDHMPIIGDFDLVDYSNESCTPYIIKNIGFLNCSAFVYNVLNDGFDRFAGGLMLRGNATFGFGQFQSINASHVAVCSDVIRAKVGVARGCRTIARMFTIAVALIAAIMLI